MHTHTLQTHELVVGTWLGDHQGRSSAPLSRCVKVSKYGVLINILQLRLESALDNKDLYFRERFRTCIFYQYFFKYANDTNLLVPEHTDVQLCNKFEAIQLWAQRNKMIINTSKTQEIVFRRPNSRVYSVDLIAIQAIEKIKETKLLGFIFTDSFHFDVHVNFILKISS